MKVKELVRELVKKDWDAEVFVLWKVPEGYDPQDFTINEVVDTPSIDDTKLVALYVHPQ